MIQQASAPVVEEVMQHLEQASAASPPQRAKISMKPRLIIAMVLMWVQVVSPVVETTEPRSL